MYAVKYAKSFKHAWKRLKRSGKFSEDEFRTLLPLLRLDNALPPEYRDHALTGEYVGCRECHIQGDFLLVYEKHNDVFLLILVNIGTHHELFGT